MVLTYLFVGMVGLYTAVAAVVDVRLHRIPNYLTVPAALLGLLYHTVMPNGWGPLTSLTGFGVGFLLLLVPWLLGGGGMGDVKLLAALGTWLGPSMMLVAFAVAIFMAAAASLGVLIRAACDRGITAAKRKYLSVGKGRSTSKAGSRNRGRRPVRVVPFAVPLALSTWMVLAWLVAQGSI